MENPLVRFELPVPFDRIRAEHVEPAVEQLLADARASVAQIGAGTAPPTYATTLGALEAALEPLGVAMGLVGHLEAVVTTEALRNAYNAVRPEVSAFFSSISLDAALYGRLRAFADTEEARSLDPVRARHLEKTLDDFRRHGAELDDAGKARLREIDVELAKLTMRFGEHVLDASKAFAVVIDDEARLTGLPDSARDAARESARAKGVEGWRFTLQEPSLVAVLTYADDATLREAVWRGYARRATEAPHDNQALIGRILVLRGEKAELLGYEDFSDLVLEDRMAQRGAAADAFVEDLTERTRPFFDRETSELASFRRELEGDDAPPLAPWDVGYYAEKLRRARHDFDEQALRPYLPVDAVMQGLFETVQRLYGVAIEADAGMPVWHEDVRTFRLVDDNGRLVGAFYADLHPRESKRSGAWMNPVYTGGPGEPHVGLFCANVSPSVGGKPALLTHREVETLFHEFGHLMHHLLSDVPVKSLAGTSVAWDFVELPSQIMENWTWEREALDCFARHWETGERIPDDLYRKMVGARTFRAASAQMRQLGFAALDLSLHRRYDPARDGDVMGYAHRILEAHAPTPLPEDYGMVASFNHLFGAPVAYAAGYYSYKWAEVLDADAFTRFTEAGVFSPEVGRRFRDTLLSRGNSEDPAVLFERFMGRGPDLQALLAREGLVAEVPAAP